MPANSDHVRRDAEHACRNEISTCLGKFQRRMNETGKAAIATELQGDLPSVIDFDYGTELGRKAAAAAILEHIFTAPEEVQPKPLQAPKAT